MMAVDPVSLSFWLQGGTAFVWEATSLDEPQNRELVRHTGVAHGVPHQTGYERSLTSDAELIFVTARRQQTC